MWSLAYVIQGDTEKEARQLYDYYVRQKVTSSPRKSVLITNMAHAQTWSEQLYASVWKTSSQGLDPIRSLVRPNRSSTDCRCCQMQGSRAWSYPGRRIGAAWSSFREKVLPLLKQAGLR